MSSNNNQFKTSVLCHKCSLTLKKIVCPARFSDDARGHFGVCNCNGRRGTQYCLSCNPKERHTIAVNSTGGQINHISIRIDLPTSEEDGSSISSRAVLWMGINGPTFRALLYGLCFSLSAVRFTVESRHISATILQQLIQ